MERGRFRLALAGDAWALDIDGRPLVLQGLPWLAGETRPTREGAAPSGARAWDEGTWHREGRALRIEGQRWRGLFDLTPHSITCVEAGPPTPAPEPIAPMLARAAAYPHEEEDYAFEPKWDGIRAIAHLDAKGLRLRTRNLREVTAEYPELAGVAAAVGRDAVLDGEIVAPDETGRPSFQRLQSRLGVATPRMASALSREVPVVFVAFDLLHLDGADLMPLPWSERRARLESLGLDAPHWRTTPVGDGRALLAMPQWEGVVAKRIDAPYVPGERAHAWIKVKTTKRQELVIGGWTPGRGGRAGSLGALHVGYYEDGRLRYAGKVGTGFSDATLADLRRRLAKDVRPRSPFADAVDEPGSTFVEPRYVGEFEFTEWTAEGRLRHPSFKGLRSDKDPREVVKEG